ncbi:MAG: hypothetical protein IJU76_02430 [Desulfovibrionaceae bacterium]|nr:hypothetical protein [Desulfovibrionaceae bacterium]
MPCENVIARLLNVHREPFTIKLTYQSKEYTQPHTLGVDPGSIPMKKVY